jgi:hypothetical protein
MTNHEKLMLAFTLVEEVRSAMDCNRTGCEHCGVERYDNHNEFSFDQSLGAAARRIKRVAGEMERKDLVRHMKEVAA